MLRKISTAFTGGVVGALVNSVSLWILSHAGLLAMAGIDLKVRFTLPWLYPRLVWGGVWALGLLLPFLKNRVLLRGLAFSLAPSALTLFKFLPESGKGMMGIELGISMPLLVLLINGLYGIVASLWHHHGAK